MNKWQPIDTAPKDGELVIGYGVWAGEINGVSDMPIIQIIYWGGGKGDYPGTDWWVGYGSDAYATWLRATHWMPLPEPPQ